MKKLMTIFATMLLAVMPMAARDRVTTDVNVLPAQARELVQKYYGKVDVNHIKVYSNMFGKSDFDVILNNGTELEFDNDGALKEINCGRNAVPNELVLRSIRDYVSKNFNGKKIVSMEVKSHKYDIELSNGLDLEFDRAGNFLRIDD